MPALSLSLFGPFEARFGGQPVTDFRSVKAQALLIYLVVERERPHRRESLFTLLWPGMPESSARHNLRQVLYSLRQMFPDLSGEDIEDSIPLLATSRQTVQLNPDYHLESDLQKLDRLLDEVSSHEHTKLDDCQHCRQALEAAVGLYKGEFLAGFYLEDSNQFEDWATATREVYQRKALEALQTLADLALNRGDFDQARLYAERQLSIDRLRESAYRQLMEILARSGRRVEALRQYRECVRILQDELGVPPSSETTALYERIQREGLPGRPPEGAPPEPALIAAPRHNLPSQATPFIGRETELDDLARFLADPLTRLITIVAPGGMGKTRLALACADRQLHQDDGRFPDGIFLISFAQLEEPERIVTAIAEAIHLHIDCDLLETHSLKAQLLEALRRKRMLLLCDSFEHFLDEAAFLGEIIQAAPGVQILVTSRERLRLHVEQVYTIGGLPFDSDGAPAEAVESPAAQLFIQSAGRIQAGFALVDGQEVDNFARIYRLVEGMPLALELAARWVDLLSLSEIAAEIQGSLGFLESELRDVPARHRGIRAVFETTWGRLSGQEREALARFSVFRAGCTRRAAKAVTGAALQTLARLSDKSLIQYEKGDSRYQIHRLLRQFAAEKLAGDPQSEYTVQLAHSAYYCAALERWEKDLKSPHQAAALEEMRADYENIRLAWEWALAHDELPYLLQAIHGLGEYFDINQFVFEARRLFQEASSRLRGTYGATPTCPDAARLLALIFARQEDTTRQVYYYPNAEESLRESLALLKSPALQGTDTRREEALIRLRLGMVLLLSAREIRIEEARKHLEVGQRLYQQLEDPVGLGDVLTALVLCAQFAGDKDQLEAIIPECLAIHRQTGDPRRLARALFHTGDVNREFRMAYDKAFADYEEAYAVSESAGNLLGMAGARRRTAWMGWFLGKFDLSLAAFTEARDLALRAGNQYRAATEQVNIGLTQAYRGQFTLAKSGIREGIRLDPRVEADETHIYLSFASIHLGRYEAVRRLAGEIVAKDLSAYRAWSSRLLSWEMLAKGEFGEALTLAQRSVEVIKTLYFIPIHEWTAWSRVPMGLAYHGLGRHEEARQQLFDALQTCLDIHAFIPLMHLMPAIPVVLLEEKNNKLKERAVELYTLAQSIPFVANSQLIEDVAGRRIRAAAAQLPGKAIEAENEPPKSVDWSQAASALLDELRELGWSQ